MRLVEVVMLVGAHCVSPVENSQVQMLTEAAKVQCAVVIEKDTDSGRVTVTPQQAVTDPLVSAALARLGTPTAAPRIVPAFAPAGSPTVEIKPPAARQTVPAPIAPPPEEQAVTDTPAPESETAAPEAPKVPSPTAAAAPSTQKVASIAAPATKPAVAKAAAAPKKKVVKTRATTPKANRCKGTAVMKWYRTAEGQRKYRCVNPAAAPAPSQLY